MPCIKQFQKDIQDKVFNKSIHMLKEFCKTEDIQIVEGRRILLVCTFT